MVKVCDSCHIHFFENDLWNGMCRECIANTDHNCPLVGGHGEKGCEVCNFINNGDETMSEMQNMEINN